MSTSLENLTVLIAGAGIGGVSAAIACRLKGARVTLFEQAPEILEIGAGLQLQPSATRVINKFGLRNELAEIGRIPESLNFKEARTGRVILSGATPQLSQHDADAIHYQVHRADLQKILLARATELGANIELSAAVVDTREDVDAAVLVLRDGREFKGDIVVGADGVKSAVRQSLFGADEPEFTGNIAYRMMIDASNIKEKVEASVVLGPNSHFVIYPLRNGEIINVVAQQRSDAWADESWTTPGDVNDLKEFYRGWNKSIDILLENATETYKWAMYTRPPMDAWSKGRVVLIGDACHSTLPNMGAGAAMAIEDAWVLADLIEKYCMDLPKALSMLHTLRIGRCTRVQQGSKKNANFFHISNPIARFFLYGAMSIASRYFPKQIENRLAWLRNYDATTAVAELG